MNEGIARVVKFSDIKDKIIEIREQKVILDNDVAEHYGVETKRINEAVKNNPDKFPEGYILEVNKQEWGILKSKISTSSWGGKNKLPNAFTKKGLYMLATILKSERATQATIEIIEAFEKLTELQSTFTEMTETSDDNQQKSLMKKGGDLIANLIGNELSTTEDETTIELNLAVLKFKHTTKRKKNNS
jgi:phage regulator Rha-like protein